MRREELVMEVLGELDDRLIAEALPKDSGKEKNFEHHELDFASDKMPEVPKITPKDIRRYRIRNAVIGGLAAALVITGGVFLWNILKNAPPVKTDNKPAVTIDSTLPNITEPDIADRFLIITDTTMPEPFAVNENPTVYGGTDGWHDNFYDLWKKDFYAIDERLQELVGLERASEIIAGYKAEEAADNEAGNITRYKLDDTQNRYRFIMDAELSAEDVDRALRGTDNTRGGMVDPDILVTFASKEETVKENMTDYCIAVGEYVFSPRWLYYHTIEDYKEAGIKPAMLHSKMSRYKELGLTDEAWRAFCQKYYAFYFGLDRNSSDVTDLTIFDEPNDPVLDDNAFDILEKFFYGEWKTSSDNGYPAGTLTLKYDISQGYHFNLTAVFEYDDMYIMEYGSSGIGNCCIIQKDEPDVMYWTETGFGFGSTVITSPLENMTKYTERKDETPGLNVGGEISPLGEKYLVYKYGDEFGKVYKNTLDVYSVSMAAALFEDERGSLYLANGYTSSDIRRYLVAMSDNAVTLGVPYVRDWQELETPEYFAVTLTKNENGEWSVEYRPLEEVYERMDSKTYTGATPDYYEGLLPELELKDVLRAGESLSFQSAVVKLRAPDGEVRASCSLASGMVGLNGYGCTALRDPLVELFNLENRRILIVVGLPMWESEFDRRYLTTFYLYDGEPVLRRVEADGDCLEVIVKDSTGISQGEDGTIYCTQPDGLRLEYHIGENGHAALPPSQYD